MQFILQIMSRRKLLLVLIGLLIAGLAVLFFLTRQNMGKVPSRGVFIMGRMIR